jgi:hypothetical protein
VLFPKDVETIAFTDPFIFDVEMVHPSSLLQFVEYLSEEETGVAF